MKSATIPPVLPAAMGRSPPRGRGERKVAIAIRRKSTARRGTARQVDGSAFASCGAASSCTAVEGQEMRRQFLLGFILWLCAWLGGGHPPRAMAANTPTKLTVMVPMRDGVHLATDVRLPAGDGPWPVALARTPYNKNNIQNFTTMPLPGLTANGIVVVAQDVRGRFASEGQARMFVDDGRGTRQDGVDTLAWIRQQPWCNGKIATFG